MCCVRRRNLSRGTLPRQGAKPKGLLQGCLPIYRDSRQASSVLSAANLKLTSMVRHPARPRSAQEPAVLVQLLADPVQQILRVDHLRGAPHRLQAGMAQHVDDAAAGDLVLPCELPEVDVGRERVGLASEVVLPQAQ